MKLEPAAAAGGHHRRRCHRGVIVAPPAAAVAAARTAFIFDVLLHITVSRFSWWKQCSVCNVQECAREKKVRFAMQELQASVEKIKKHENNDHVA